MSAAPSFTVKLHHLAVDAKEARANLPDVELADVSPKQLRRLLDALATLAPNVHYPLAPSVRIDGPHGQFLVQTQDGKVRVTSWSAQAGVENLTPERILAMIMGAEADTTQPPDDASVGWWGGLSRGGRIALLAIAIVGSNAATAWMLTRPAPVPTSLLPEHRFVDRDRAQRMLAEFAGDFATGAAAGDRRLTIQPDGALRWITLGANGAAAEQTTLKARAAESRGHAVLVADNLGMIEMKDPITLVYFGDTYRRTAP
jgi:hypothetical protein